jgi:hypothetical protein
MKEEMSDFKLMSIRGHGRASIHRPMFCDTASSKEDTMFTGLHVKVPLVTFIFAHYNFLNDGKEF